MEWLGRDLEELLVPTSWKLRNGYRVEVHQMWVWVWKQIQAASVDGGFPVRKQWDLRKERCDSGN